MYKRDFAILLLSAFAIYFSVQREGPVSFRQAWYFPSLQPSHAALSEILGSLTSCIILLLHNRYHHLDEESLLEAHDVLCPPVVVGQLAYHKAYHKNVEQHHSLMYASTGRPKWRWNR